MFPCGCPRRFLKKRLNVWLNPPDRYDYFSIPQLDNLSASVSVDEMGSDLQKAVESIPSYVKTPSCKSHELQGTSPHYPCYLKSECAFFVFPPHVTTDDHENKCEQVLGGREST